MKCVGLYDRLIKYRVTVHPGWSASSCEPSRSGVRLGDIWKNKTREKWGTEDNRKRRRNAPAFALQRG
jgi:hypothetical protein